MADTPTPRTVWPEHLAQALGEASDKAQAVLSAGRRQSFGGRLAQPLASWY